MALAKEVSLTRLARRYGVSFTTARKWVINSDVEAFRSPARLASLKELVVRSPLEAKRRRIDKDLESRLADTGDRKILARAIVDEFNLRFSLGTSGCRRRYILWLKVTMYDGPPVEQVAGLMGSKCTMRYRKSRSGTEVPNWNSEANGYRAFRILQLVRPYLVGQKAFQADWALKAGPLCDCRPPSSKAEYKSSLLASIPSNRKKVPASRLPDSSRKSVAPGRRAV